MDIGHATGVFLLTPSGVRSTPRLHSTPRQRQSLPSYPAVSVTSRSPVLREVHDETSICHCRSIVALKCVVTYLYQDRELLKLSPIFRSATEVEIAAGVLKDPIIVPSIQTLACPIRLPRLPEVVRSSEIYLVRSSRTSWSI